jgi:hypothetical protein
MHVRRGLRRVNCAASEMRSLFTFRGVRVSASEKEIASRIEAPASFANQVAPVMGLPDDAPVIFPSRNVRKDLASRLDHIHRHGRLHHESMVKATTI